MPDVSSIPFKQADPNGHYRSKQLPNDSGDFMQMLGLPAFAGDVVGPGGATEDQVAVFGDATGKRLEAATQTGLAKLSGGVLSSVTAPVGEVVGTTDPQVLTNKTLINPTLEGVTGFDKDDVGLGNVDNTSDASKPVSGPQQAALDLKEDKNKKAVANGYASLDASVKIPLDQIPDSVLGGQQYQGTWNAATNTPAIPTAVLGNKGWYYSVAVAGTTNINGISSWAVGDEIISNGSVWQKIVNVSAVNSVNGYTGVVVLGKADVGLGNVDNTSDSAKPVSAATVTQLALKEDKTNKNVANGYAGLDATGKVPAANVPADLVTSVAAKQGVVTLVKGDVGLGNVDNTSDATKNSASVTLTNHTINGANNTLTVRLASDVTGNLPVTNLNAGTGANSGSFWRGDGQWAPPAGGGDVIGPAGGVVDGEVVSYNSTTGKIIKASGGKLTASLVAGPASVTSGRIASYGDATGKLIADGGKLAADLVVGPAASVDSEVMLFSGTGGKTSKRATGTGLVSVVSGVYQSPVADVGTILPIGAVVQTVSVDFPGWVQSTNIIPSDDTTPQIGEGTELTTATITPVYANSRFWIFYTGTYFCSAAMFPVFALFKNSVANALKSAMAGSPAANVQQEISIQHLDVAQGSLTPIVYRIRYGPTGAGNVYINGNTASRQLGGTQAVTLTVMEIKQ